MLLHSREPNRRRAVALSAAGFIVAGMLLRQLAAPVPDAIGSWTEDFNNGRVAFGRVVGTSGFTPCENGFCLQPGERGTLDYQVPDSGARGLRLRLWFHHPERGTNAVSISTDGGERFHLIPADRHFPDGRTPLDVRLPLDPSRPAILRFQAANTGRSPELPLDQVTAIALTGPEAPLPSPLVVFAAVLAAGLPLTLFARRRAFALALVLLTATGAVLRYEQLLLALDVRLDPDAGMYRTYAAAMRLFTDTGFFSGAFGKREPLWILTAHAWFRLVGDSAFHLRGLSVILSVCVIPVGALVAARLFGAIVGLSAGAVLAFSEPLAFESARGLRLELEMLLVAAFVWTAFVRPPARRAVFTGALGLLGGTLTLLRSTYSTIVIPLALLAVARHRPRRAWVRDGAVVVAIVVALVAPHRYGLYRVHGDPFWDTASYARAVANEEFAGTPGFPSYAEIQKDGQMGPRITYAEYLFGLHTPGDVVKSTARGYWKILRKMSVCRDLGPPPTRTCEVVDGVVQGLGVAGLAIGATSTAYLWLPAGFLVSEFPSTFLFDKGLLENYRHSFHGYLFLLLGAGLAIHRMTTAVRWRRASRPGGGPAKVLYVIGSLDIGGTEQQLATLVEGLDRSRFEPVVCCLNAAGPVAARLAAAGVHVEVIGLRKLSRRTGSVAGHLVWLVRRTVHFFTYVRRERPEIVHGLLFLAYVPAAFAAWLARVPVIVSSRRGLGHFKAGRVVPLAMERLANAVTDLVIANSEAVRRDAIAQEHLDPNRVIVIYNGIDTAGGGLGRDERLVSELGLDGAGAIVIVIANFIQYKGHDVFLAAWRQVIDACPGSVAVLVGDGPTRADREQQCRSLGIEQAVRFAGRRSDVARLLALADVAVHPSFEEGFSNAILEAMAAALPVVATNVGGNGEAVVDGVTGRLVPANDAPALAEAITVVLQDGALRARLGAAGRHRASVLFDRRAAIASYEQVYLDLLRGTQPGHERGCVPVQALTGD